MRNRLVDLAHPSCGFKRLFQHFAAQSTQADVTHRITLRYMSGITPKMRVNYNSRIFDILSVINVGERNRELQLMCRESIG